MNVTARDFGTHILQVKLALEGDDAPDIASGDIGWSLSGPLVQAGLIRDLSPWMETYGWDTRYPDAAYKQFSFSEDGNTFGSGSVYGLPYAADVMGWFYNKEKLVALGGELPETLADFEALLAAAKAAGEVPLMIGNKEGWAAQGSTTFWRRQLHRSSRWRDWCTVTYPSTTRTRSLLMRWPRFRIGPRAATCPKM